MGKSRYGDFCAQNGPGRVGRLRMASLNNFSGLWGIAAVPSLLVPGPGVMRAGG